MTGEFQYFIKIAYSTMVNQEYVNIVPYPNMQHNTEVISNIFDQESTGMFQSRICNWKLDLQKILN